MTWPMIGAGFFTGFLVGLTGVGGGALMTPLLLLVFGVPPRVAVGTDLLFAALTKLAATRIFHGNGLVDWEIVRRLWWGSLPAAALTLVWVHHLSRTAQDVAFLKQAIAAAVLWGGMALFFQPILQRLGRRYSGTAQQDNMGSLGWWLTVCAGALLGTLVTLTSVGAGALGAVMLLHLYPVRLTPDRLIATDIAHAIPLALIAGVGHMSLGNVDFSILGTLLIGSIPGAIIGASLTTRLPYALVRSILSLTLLSLGMKLWWVPR
jgi:uncharacterized protein